MSFMLRKELPHGKGERYIVVTSGYESQPLPGAATLDPDVARATRFPTREDAERWRAVLDGPYVRVAVVEV